MVWLALAAVLYYGITIHWPGLVPFVTVVLFYPLLEELAFRGAIQGLLLDRCVFTKPIWWRISSANAITSVLFCAAHFINQPPVWALGTLVPSLVFGYFRERYDGVTVPIILHCWYNFGFVLWVMR